MNIKEARQLKAGDRIRHDPTGTEGEIKFVNANIIGVDWDRGEHAISGAIGRIPLDEMEDMSVVAADRGALYDVTQRPIRTAHASLDAKTGQVSISPELLAPTRHELTAMIAALRKALTCARPFVSEAPVRGAMLDAETRATELLNRVARS